jgi:hypothetical protein
MEATSDLGRTIVLIALVIILVAAAVYFLGGGGKASHVISGIKNLLRLGG